jgi:protein gp37
LPVAVHFLSCEPLLSPLRLPADERLRWIICGGGSGVGARDMPADWARALRDRCAETGTAFFMKQMARKRPIPADLIVRQFPDGTVLPNAL